MSLIHQLVIRIHFCPLELAVILQGRTVRSGRILELSKSIIAHALGAE